MSRRYRPRRIKIGAHVCKIKRVDPNEMIGPEIIRENKALMKVGTHYAVYGEITLDDLTIRMPKNLPPTLEAETLAHEVAHGIIELQQLRGLFKDTGAEEKFVQSFMAVFTEVLMENPSFRRMFGE